MKSPAVSLAIAAAANLVTAAIVILLLTRFNLTHLMSLNFFFVVPIGAAVIGFLCGLGAMVASFFLGIRLSLPVVIGAGVLHVVIFLGLKTIEHQAFYASLQSNGSFPDLSIWTFFHTQTEDKVLEIVESFKLRKALDQFIGSIAGVFQAVEVGGFVAGGVYGLRWLARRPRCDTCARYMREKTIVGLPVSTNVAKAANDDEQAQEQEDIWDLGHAQAQEFLVAIATDDATETKEALVAAREFAFEHRRRGNQRIIVSHAWCTGCGEGSAVATLVTEVEDAEIREVVGAVPLSGGHRKGLLYA